MNDEQQYKTGDSVNGHWLGADNRWHPLKDEEPEAPKKNKGKRILIGAAVFLVGVSVIGALTPSEVEPVAAESSAEAPAPTKKPTPTPTPTPELPMVCQDLSLGSAGEDAVKALYDLQVTLGISDSESEVQASCPQYLADYQRIIAPPTKEQFAAIGGREWQLLLKDPEAHKGELYVAYGQVTQFDANTGTTTFRADVTGQLPEKDYSGDYEFWLDGENSMVSGSEGLLGGIVTDDYLKMWVEVTGVEHYETSIGQATATTFKVHHIDIIGHES